MNDKKIHHRLSMITMTIMSLFIPASSFAFFCPTNFNQIDFGMTMDQVTQICGKPVSQKESKKEDDNVPQEWVYFIPQAVGMNNFQQAQGTLRTSFSFDDKGKAVNISVNGIGVGASSICGNRNVQLGDSRDTIQAACGKPSYVTKQTSLNGPKQDTKVTEFNYSNGNPPTILIFENGKLTDKK